MAYRRLIEMYYDTEQPIPELTQSVSRRLRVATEALNVVLQDFFVFKNGAYHHARCDHEIAEYNKKADIARANGRNGGRRKAAPVLEKNPAGSVSVATKNPTPTRPLANQEPRTINHKPIKEKSAVAPHLLGIPEKLLSDFLEVRKAKRAGKLTETALKGLEREGQKAGLTTIEAITACVEYGWQGFNAGWYEERHKIRASNSMNSTTKYAGAAAAIFQMDEEIIDV